MHKQKFVISIVLPILTALTAYASDATFSTPKEDAVYWKQPWVAQSLHYPSGVIVEKINAALKDGLENNAVVIEFFKDYDGKGNFSNSLGSGRFVIKTPNAPDDYVFKDSIVLTGSKDGVYYMKISPGQGGEVNALANWGDVGVEALRHGKLGRMIIHAEPDGIGKPDYKYDIASVSVFTNPTAKPPVSVLDFGAKGDGLTNDTKALQAAIDSGAGCIVLPMGTYVLGPETITLPANVTLQGQGKSSVIQPTKNTKTLFRVSSGAVLKNFSIDGKFVTPNTGTAEGLICITAGKGSVVDSISISDCPRTCIFADHARDFTISNCNFTKIGVGVSLVFCHRGRVMNNFVQDASVHGLQFWGTVDHDTGHWKKDSSQLIFSGNIIKNGGAGAIWGCGSTQVILSNNIIDGAKDVGLDLEFCDDSVITGNVAQNCVNAPISLFYACKRITITGNTAINNCKLSAEEEAKINEALNGKTAGVPWYVRSGIWLTHPNRETLKDDFGHEDITIVGNTIYTAKDGIPRRDIWIGSEVKNVRIEGNVISGAGIFYGGHHQCGQQLIKLGPQPIMLDKRPAIGKPKF